MSTYKKDLRISSVQRDVIILVHSLLQIVNFSVKAQDMLLKQGMQSFKTTDDLSFLGSVVKNNENSLINATTNLSQNDFSKHFTANLSKLKQL